MDWIRREGRDERFSLLQAIRSLTHYQDVCLYVSGCVCVDLQTSEVVPIWVHVSICINILYSSVSTKHEITHTYTHIHTHACMLDHQPLFSRTFFLSGSLDSPLLWLRLLWKHTSGALRIYMRENAVTTTLVLNSTIKRLDGCHFVILFSIHCYFPITFHSLLLN